MSATYVFKWPKGPKDVILTGTFDKWSKSLYLVKQTDGSFELTVPLPKDTDGLYFKYIVDGKWEISPNEKTSTDHEGNVNNYLSKADLVPLTARIPESGGLFVGQGAEVNKGTSGAADSSKDTKTLDEPTSDTNARTSNGSNPSKPEDLKTTVLPRTDLDQPTFGGAPGLFVPQNADSIDAFKQVSNVDPKSLNEPESDSGNVNAAALPQSDSQQKSLTGEPGIHVPKDPQSISAFQNVSDVDPKSLNKPEVSPEEKKKLKKKVKRSQYKAKKKRAAAAGGASTAGAVAGSGVGAGVGAASGTASGQSATEPSELDTDGATPEPEHADKAASGTTFSQSATEPSDLDTEATPEPEHAEKAAASDSSHTEKTLDDKDEKSALSPEAKIFGAVAVGGLGAAGIIEGAGEASGIIKSSEGTSQDGEDKSITVPQDDKDFFAVNDSKVPGGYFSESQSVDDIPKETGHNDDDTEKSGLDDIPQETSNDDDTVENTGLDDIPQETSNGDDTVDKPDLYDSEPKDLLVSSGDSLYPVINEDIEHTGDHGANEFHLDRGIEQTPSQDQVFIIPTRTIESQYTTDGADNEVNKEDSTGALGAGALGAGALGTGALGAVGDKTADVGSENATSLGNDGVEKDTTTVDEQPSKDKDAVSNVNDVEALKDDSKDQDDKENDKSHNWGTAAGLGALGAGIGAVGGATAGATAGAFGSKATPKADDAVDVSTGALGSGSPAKDVVPESKDSLGGNDVSDKRLDSANKASIENEPSGASPLRKTLDPKASTEAAGTLDPKADAKETLDTNAAKVAGKTDKVEDKDATLTPLPPSDETRQESSKALDGDANKEVGNSAAAGIIGASGGALASPVVNKPEATPEREVDAEPVSKSETDIKKAEALDEPEEEEIVIAQGVQSRKEIENVIHAREGDDVSVEEIKPSKSELEKLKKDAVLEDKVPVSPDGKFPKIVPAHAQKSQSKVPPKKTVKNKSGTKEAEKKRGFSRFIKKIFS